MDGALVRNCVAAALVLWGCGAQDRPAAVPVAAPSASALAVPAAATDEPPVEAAAAAPLAELPQNAPFYLSVNLRQLGASLNALPLSWVDRKIVGRELRGVLGFDPFGDLPRTMEQRFGLDPSRPVVFGGTLVDETRTRAAVDRLIELARAKRRLTPETLQSVFAVHPPLLGYSRFVAQLTDPSKVVALAEWIRRVFPQLDEFVACAGRACAPFAAAGLRALVTGPGLVLLFSVDGRTLTVEVVDTLFLRPEAAVLAGALHRLRDHGLGGPTLEQSACRFLDLQWALSMCISPEQVGALAAVVGRARTVEALVASSLEPHLAGKLLQVGSREADSPKRLARSAVRFVDQGAFALGAGPSGLELRAWWTLTDRGRRAVTRVVGSGLHLRSSDELFDRLIAPLRDALGDPGPPYAGANARAVIEQIQMGGYLTYPVLYARVWPNLLASLLGDELLGARSEIPPELRQLEVRWRVDGSVLELQAALQGSAPRSGRGPSK